MKKIALITGSATRIGKMIVKSLVEDGWQVVIHYNNSQDEAEILLQELNANNLQAFSVQADLIDENQTKSIFPYITKNIGQVSLLINNAASFINDNVANSNYEIWHQNMSVNLRAPFLLMKDFKEQLLEQRGNIINILDYCVTKLPVGKFLSYSLSKNALWELTKLFAIEFAPQIRVNALGPGSIMRGIRQSEENFTASRIHSPLNNAGSIEDIYNAIKFILTTPSITGELINIDGGKHLSGELNY
ncbi:3-oxoacyl-[acyl-carrier-protein] reductase FabG [Rickettsiales bacterium Ac37b]|nr:3-oxoacyl-[acyl-carrier-protein] reductase FabG [Rickettsiales bacterium Ac37b]